MLIEIRSIAPAAIARVQVKDIAFSDVDEEADRTTASSNEGQQENMTVEKRRGAKGGQRLT